MVAKFPSAFINAIAEEGTKAEAVEHLQQTWDELQTLKTMLGEYGLYLKNGILVEYPSPAKSLRTQLQALRTACIAEGYSPEYLANGALTKRRAWRD